MTQQVYKAFDGKRWLYSYNEQRYRTSKREFKYACIAHHEGNSWVLSLGNDKESTYRSKAQYYAHWCDALEVVEIQPITNK
jgi:hypothetical protein